MPVHLAAQASTTIDIGMLIAMAQPDAKGNLIPNYIQEGSVVFSNAKGRARWMTLAVCGAFYNPRKATCGEYWVDCCGYSGPEVALNSFSVAVSNTTQSHAYLTGGDCSGPASLLLARSQAHDRLVWLTCDERGDRGPGAGDGKAGVRYVENRFQVPGFRYLRRGGVFVQSAARDNMSPFPVGEEAVATLGNERTNRECY